MHVMVLGSGVIGVSTAYYLAKSGQQVTVVDRQNGPALETSYANAGEVSPGYAAPWAAPGIPLKALKWLFMKHRPLVIWPRLDPGMWAWGLRMLRNCTASRYELNKGRMLRLAQYSRDCLRVSTVMVETYKVAATRLGERIRVGGSGRVLADVIAGQPAEIDLEGLTLARYGPVRTAFFISNL